MLLQKVKWINSHLQEITLWFVCEHTHALVMHHVCFTVSLLVPFGNLMNRHALPIEVKVTAAISARHEHLPALWREATSVYHCCQLHCLPAGAMFVLVHRCGTHGTWTRLGGNNYLITMGCGWIFIVVVDWGTVCCLPVCATVKGNCK